MKVCIVSSCGGHLTAVRCLKPAYGCYEHFYVLNDKALLPEDMRGKTYFIAHSERDWKFFLNLWEALRILRREKPDLILSSGASPAVPFALLGLLFGLKIVYAEDMARAISPSLTGRIMYRLSHHFFYQWPALGAYFPKGVCGGIVV